MAINFTDLHCCNFIRKHLSPLTQLKNLCVLNKAMTKPLVIHILLSEIDSFQLSATLLNSYMLRIRYIRIRLKMKRHRLFQTGTNMNSLLSAQVKDPFRSRARVTRHVISLAILTCANTVLKRDNPFQYSSPGSTCLSTRYCVYSGHWFTEF